MLLGVGLGGFVDGIVFHQLLKWHHMVSNQEAPDTLPALETNVTWDGAFHAATWVAVAVGLGLLWRLERRYDLRWSWVLFGSLLIGWGAFNLIEGIINHHILALHHVRDDLGGPLGWDLAFLASGVLLLAIGWFLVQTRRPRIGAPSEDG